MNLDHSPTLISSCAFTGHRPHKFPWRYDEADAGCVELKALLSELVKKLTDAGIIDFFSGMADGTDIWLAQAVLSHREENPALKLHCVLPCEGQELKWAAPARERYHSILDQADSILYVSHAYYDGCMLARNRRLVDLADILLAVYNGEWRGGTAATVRYAQKAGRGIILLHPVSRHISIQGTIPNISDWQTAGGL